MRSHTRGALPLTVVSEAQLLCGHNTGKLKEIDTFKIFCLAGKRIIVLKLQRLTFTLTPEYLEA